MHTLYILMRNDLDSLSSGKAMAQASHASNAFVHQAEKLAFSNEEVLGSLEEWRGETTQGFGTVIVLGGSMNDIVDTIDMMQKDYICEIVHDPTYPIKDGDVTHLIPLNTCAYVFVPYRIEDMKAKTIISKFELHP